MELLFNNLDKLLDAPNGIEKARQLILQLAVQGKLVKQDPNDEPASELLKKIKKEKEKLIAEGKIKKQKELPPIKEDEKPFELPSGWIFEKIGNIFFTTSGGTPSRGKSEFWDGNIPWLKSGELDDNMNITQTEEFITEEGLKNSSAKIFAKGSVVMALYGATAGKVGILGIDTTTNQAVCNFYKTTFVKSYYLFYYLKANRFKIIQECFGGAQPNISQDYVKKMIFGLPPLSEQKRIVEKVNSLMALLDEIEEKRERRNRERIRLNNSSFDKLLTSKDDKKLKTNWKRIEENFNLLYSVPENVVKLKQAILQLAVQGKLVEQNPNDEPASELLKKIKKEKEKLIAEGKIKKQKELPPIKDDEKPFELPKGWVWERLPHVSFFQEGPGILAKDFRKQGIPLIRISGLHNRFVSLEGCNYLDSKMVVKKWSHFKLSLGDIILSSSASLGKVAKVNNDTVGSIPYTGLIRFQPYSCLNGEYLIHFFKTDEFLRQINKSKTGAAIKHFGPTHLRSMIVPLPPLNEQKRIVEKVNELMSLCNALEEKLTKKEEKAERLVGGVVNRVINNQRD